MIIRLETPGDVAAIRIVEEIAFGRRDGNVIISTVIACDKREAFAQGSAATKQSMPQQADAWIASLRSQ